MCTLSGGLHKGKNYAEQLVNEQVAARRIIRGAQELLLARAKELQEQANAALDSCPKETLTSGSPGPDSALLAGAQEGFSADHGARSATKRIAACDPQDEIRPVKRPGE